MPSVTVAADASCVTLHGHAHGGGGGGLRGRVMGFSRKSRKRMLDLMNCIHENWVSEAVFLTLTYADVFPEDAARWKRDLDVFCKRMRRQYPRAAVVWRLEWVPRRSGVNVGRLAPHFHLLVFGVPWMDLRWLATAWYETVDSGDERHLGAGTQAQRVRSRRGVMHYCAKYMGKTAMSPPFWTGRVWGVIGRELLPILLRTRELTWEQFYRMRRVMRRWVDKQTRRKRWTRFRGQGITAYLSEREAWRLYAWSVTAA